MNETRSVGPVTKSATGGAVVAGAITTLIVWGAGAAGVEIPEIVAGAITTLLTAAGALIGGWLVRPGTGKRVDDGR